MALLEKYYQQKLIKVPTVRSAYGDITIDPTGELTTIMGRFRVITNMVRVSNRDELRSDEAMFWCNPDTDLSQFDVLRYEGRHWQVVRINEARRLGKNDVQFLKCYLSAYEVIS